VAGVGITTTPFFTTPLAHIHLFDRGSEIELCGDVEFEEDEITPDSFHFFSTVL
jgi:hypothetical protein